MDLVVDANILFAALIKQGATTSLLFHDRLQLFTPDYIFAEFEEHKSELLEKTERTEEEFIAAIHLLKRRITIVPLEELVPFVSIAEQITPDPDDLAYIALALKQNCAIWSHDARLREQKRVRIYGTKELLEALQSEL